jgi:hypothetical protein
MTENPQTDFFNDPALATPEVCKILLEVVHQHHQNGNYRCMNDGLLLKRFMEIKIKGWKGKDRPFIQFADLVDWLDPKDMPAASYEAIVKITMSQGRALPDKQTEGLILWWIDKQGKDVTWYGSPAIHLWTEAIKQAWLQKFPHYLKHVPEAEERHFFKALEWSTTLAQVGAILEDLWAYSSTFRRKDPEILQRIRFCAHRRAGEIINQRMKKFEDYPLERRMK